MKLKVLCTVLAVTAVMAAAFALPSFAYNNSSIPVIYYDRYLNPVAQGTATVSSLSFFYGQDPAHPGYYKFFEGNVLIHIPFIKDAGYDEYYDFRDWISLYVNGTQFNFSPANDIGVSTSIIGRSYDGSSQVTTDIELRPGSGWVDLSTAQGRLIDLYYNGMLGASTTLRIQVVLPANADTILAGIDQMNSDLSTKLDVLAGNVDETNELLAELLGGDMTAEDRDFTDQISDNISAIEDCPVSPYTFEVGINDHNDDIKRPLNAIATIISPQFKAIMDEAQEVSSVTVRTSTKSWVINPVLIWLVMIAMMLGGWLLSAWIRGRYV